MIINLSLWPCYNIHLKFIQAKEINRTHFLCCFTDTTHLTYIVVCIIRITSNYGTIKYWSDRNYMDDQTSRREMKEKISLDTATSSNTSIAWMITYDASGWFLFSLILSPSLRNRSPSLSLLSLLLSPVVFFLIWFFCCY